MNLYLLLATLTIVNAGVVPDTECDGVIIDGNYYDKEILKTGIKGPKYVVADHNANIIYFSYSVNEFHSESALYDLKTKEFKKIDVPFGGDQTVDQNTHNVYMTGLRTGSIYKYDYTNSKPELYAAIDKGISSIYFKDVLYFTEFPSLNVYTFIDGDITRFKDFEDIKVYAFIIDSEDNIYYHNSTGLYTKKKGSKDAVLYRSDLFVRAFRTDIHGNAYMLCSTDNKRKTKLELYKIDNKNGTSLEKMMDMSDYCGLTFDGNNNLIYSDCENLVRLIVNKDKTC